MSDAGCILDKYWLERISKPLREEKADAVAGFYRMKTNSLFTHCSAPFVGIMSHNIKKQIFLPSSRSIAFTKQAWKQVGGYPSWLNYAEDLVFAQNLHDHPDITMVTRKSALVEWTPPENLKSFFKAIKNYTRGNIEAGYTRHLKKNVLVAVRYVMGFSLLLAAIVSGHPVVVSLVSLVIFSYLIYPSVKFSPLIKKPIHVIYFAILQIVADLAVISAMLRIN